MVVEHGTDFDNVIKENIAPIEYYELLVSEPSEGSLYEITFSIQPYVPADLVQGLYKASNIRLQREADLQNAQDRQRLEAERVRAVEQQRIAEQQAAAARAQALREQNARQLATNCAQVGQLRSSVQAYGPTTRSNFTNIGRSPIPRWSWRRAQRKLRTCIRAA